MSQRPQALVFEQSAPRFAAARLASQWRSGAGSSGIGPLRFSRDHEPLSLPGPGWVRIQPQLCGICASDLAAVDGRSSSWFDPLVSMPFVPGHEVLALHDGKRVVLEPVLGCVARGVDPICKPCSEGRLGNCGNLVQGNVSSGLQSGFCCDTGGGWSTEMVAHESQLHVVPDELSDTAAVLIEPMACALHAALAAEVSPDEALAVIGAGTMGLGVLAAINRWSPPKSLLLAAKHPEQKRIAKELLTNITTCVTVNPSELVRAARRISAGALVGDGSRMRVTTGVDVTIDCVGSAESIESALAVTRPGGRVILLGMPGRTSLDLTALWQREISIRGAYTYGTESVDGAKHRTFDLAAELVAAANLDQLVTARYPLSRSNDAISHAGEAGRRGAIKIAFDMTRSTTP